MIARMWRGWVATEKAAEYVAYVTETGIAGYRATPGNRGAQFYTEDDEYLVGRETTVGHLAVDP
jgi:hypothetical protein